MMLIDVFCLFKYFDIHKEKILQIKPYYYDKNLLLFVKPFFDRKIACWENIAALAGVGVDCKPFL